MNLNGCYSVKAEPGNEIIVEIINRAIQRHAATGREPHTVYLGRKQIDSLLQWAERMGYIHSAKDAIIEGECRPVIRGMQVYQVNADNHVACL